MKVKIKWKKLKKKSKWFKIKFFFFYAGQKLAPAVLINFFKSAYDQNPTSYSLTCVFSLPIVEDITLVQ